MKNEEQVKRTTIRTTNNSGDKCKTYIYNYKNSIIFYKITMVIGTEPLKNIGGETIIRKGDNYTITEHRFSIKLTTLMGALSRLEVFNK